MKLDKSEISCWKCIRDSFRIGFSCRRTEKIVFNNLFKIYRLQNCQIGLLLQGEVSNRQKFPYWTTPGTYGRYVVFQFPQIKKKKKGLLQQAGSFHIGPHLLPMFHGLFEMDAAPVSDTQHLVKSSAWDIIWHEWFYIHPTPYKHYSILKNKRTAFNKTIILSLPHLLGYRY